MNIRVPTDENEELSFHEIILRQGELISDKLNLLRHEHYPPNASKDFASFR